LSPLQVSLTDIFYNYNRLKTWNNNNDIQEYNYDIYGNMLNNSYNTNMSYNNKNQIVSKITNDNKTYNYTYDENGNILNDGTKTMSHTPFNKIIQYS
jgi:YD repeat-containing protein